MPEYAGSHMSALAEVFDMRGSMTGMMKNMEAVKMTGDADRDFASMMKMHHQGAIDMAQVELKSGKDAKMRSMAKKIIIAQQKEIKEIDQWLGKPKGDSCRSSSFPVPTGAFGRRRSSQRHRRTAGISILFVQGLRPGGD